MSARDGASVQDKFGRSLAGRDGHKHPRCGHGCFCFNARTSDCQKCQTKAANEAMAATYAEDSMTTAQILERRG